MIVKAQIDSRIVVAKRDLPAGAAEAIRARLTVPNHPKQVAVKRGDYGAGEMPDAFYLYAETAEYLSLPRGFAADLRAGLERLGAQVSWDDCTAAPSVPLLESLAIRAPTLREYQERACQAILQHRQGVLSSPTASGKTVTALEAWRRSGATGLVLVEKAALARQWRERAREHLGIETGMIGDGEWDERPLTIAMMQTIVRRGIETLPMTGMTIVDECHHAGTAITFRELVSWVTSRYLLGVTATALEGDWMQPFLLALFGPIFHVTDARELRRAGAHVTPLVKVVRTGFTWKPTTKADKALVDPRAIWRRVQNALITNEARVRLIVDTICAQPSGSAQLVVSKSLAYLDAIHFALERRGWPLDLLFKYRGAESAERKLEIAELAAHGHCVILATVADEGVDIPRLDRLHLVWPQRKDLATTQQVGRILRQHEAKRDAVVLDYVDDHPMLYAQFKARRGTYHRLGYPVDIPRGES